VVTYNKMGVEHHGIEPRIDSNNIREFVRRYEVVPYVFPPQTLTLDAVVTSQPPYLSVARDLRIPLSEHPQKMIGIVSKLPYTTEVEEAISYRLSIYPGWISYLRYALSYSDADGKLKHGLDKPVFSYAGYIDAMLQRLGLPTHPAPTFPVYRLRTINWY
jgi:hypothetical protein